VTDRAGAVVVLAKEPVAGRVKTRLQTRFTAEEAAALAGAALRDTLDVMHGSLATRRVLAWEGNADGWDDRVTVIRQPPGSLNVRLDDAFAATFDVVWQADGRAQHAAESVLLIGMDTPQVTAALLNVDWQGADAVLGLSDDGGFWAIGLRRGRPADVFSGVTMSTDRTGAAQLARLDHLGLTVKLLPPLLDVDTPAAAERIAYTHPGLRFSRTHAELVARREVQGCDLLFDRAYLATEAAIVSTDPPHALPLDVGRWVRDADEVDQLVMSRCQSPVIDLGCGPGRMVQALTETGRAALGVDTSAVAVAISQARGAPTLRRDIDEELPAEGRWGTALLMDGNIGMGGDVARLLNRCRSLVRPGGLILCEVDPQPRRHDRYDVTLRAEAVSSRPMPWVRIGGRALRDVAAAVDLLIEEEWTSGERSFVTLRVAG
jgi:glycosyltransferase A (GT-A) superfamily protein (DUF2064 family)/SAM-dependent methyltransferase